MDEMDANWTRRICVLASVVLLTACGAVAAAPGPAPAPTLTAVEAATSLPAPASAPQSGQGPVAPAIKSDTWINVKAPVEWDSLRGSVVLVEFWTFGCINCQHVIPSLVDMYATYKDKGFTIVGVHSPEFKYEHKLENVKDAVVENGIEYPVALDNDFANWQRYKNLYWPALYLVDKRGIIRYRHVGEGGYAETRAMIEQLLAE